ncbi:MAG: phosphatase PAP2 family protein [Gemmatimonadota bacterium]|nr:phosphatase PAP2 family protein [Gemmatimonadota bacterium]
MHLRRRCFLIATVLSSNGVVVGQQSPAPTADSVAKSPGPALAQSYRVAPERVLLFTRPVRLQSVRNVPRDLAQVASQAGERHSLLVLGSTVAGTALLVAADQQIVDETQRFGRRIGLSTNHSEIRVGGLLELPTTFSSGLYYIGNGWTQLGVAGGFLAFGTIRNDYRALRTASEITEALMGVGIAAQLGKHIAGRETPGTATESGGRWRPFPSPAAYAKNVPRYDAFPSGHLAALWSTVLVVAENYPEKRFIRPIGYSATALVSFVMMNNGVHWVSDYPLALVIGSAFAHRAVAGGRRVQERSSDSASPPAMAEARERGQLGVVRWLESADVVPLAGRRVLGIRLSHAL